MPLLFDACDGDHRDLRGAALGSATPRAPERAAGVLRFDVGRNPDEILRILDGLQTGELCPSNRALGGQTL